MSDPSTSPPLLLPTPRHLRLSGGTATAGVPEEVGDLALPGDEAYHLAVTPQGIRWAWRAAAGRRHAEATLAQLRVQYGDELPCLVIDDAPVFATRGVMLDVSRDRVPTMAHLLATVDQLASWKINHLQLYTEHTFAYAGHEEVWRDASPLTPAEMRTLDAHCRARGITLAANQNCFGHLASWLKHPRYAPFGEIGPDGTWDFNGLVTRRGGFSLCPSDPRSLALVEDLLGQLLPTVKGPLVNIGCDETFDLGQGRSRYEVARRGRAAVYLEFVRKICGVVARLGKRPMFWADIALEHPEALAELPAELIGLAWGYEPDAPFERWCEQLRSVGREVWVCPGTSCWRSITGRTSERRGNLLAAARAGAAHGASGYLVTAWGDLGHRQQWPVTLHALAEGAHRAWSGEAAFDPRAASLHAFADRSLALAPWLDELGDADLELRAVCGRPDGNGAATRLRNASALLSDTTRPLDEAWLGTLPQWQVVAARLDVLAARAAAFTALPALLAREVAFTCRDAQAAVRRAILRRGGTAPPPDHRQLLPEYRALWAARSRPGGLDSSCRHYELLAAEHDGG